MTTVTFTRCGSHDIVEFAYSAALVELLKTTVPSHARGWNPHLKQWSIDADCAEPLATKLRGSGYVVVGLDRTRQRQQDGEQWAHALFRAVGKQRVPAVHRALSKVLHPDVADTGCPVLQRELNDAKDDLYAAR